MPIRNRHIFILITFIAALILCMESSADQIVLKDGTVETSERIWETEGYVHFILKGTSDVEIRYAKEIVDRIERKQPAGPAAPQISVTPEKTPKVPIVKVEKNLPNPAPASGQGAVAGIPGQSLKAHQRLVQENKGLNFYDPRRPMRYWAMRNSKHKQLASALNAIAKQYDRPAKWVVDHMGQENDLGKIHKNLAHRFHAEVMKTEKPGALGIEKAANEVPPAQGVMEPETTVKPQTLPVQDATEIKQMPAMAAPALDETIEPRPTETIQAPQTPQVNPQEIAGIRFYDPRRGEKYWSSKMTRHHTLKEALNALARQYGVAPSWIETHMGETNDLSIIHQNIQKNLEQK